MRANILSLLICAAAVSAKTVNLDELLASPDPTPECSPALHACMAASLISNSNAFEECYNEAGCTHADPRLRPEWSIDNLDALQGESELRRRQNTNTAETETTTAADKTTAKTEKTTATTEKTTSEGTTTSEKTTTAKTTSAPSSASATTTADSTTADSTTTTSDASTAAASTTTTSDSTAATSTTSNSVTSGTTTGTLACSVTHTTSTKVCIYTQNKMVSCSSTTTAISTCAPGNLCFSSVAGADVCMKKDNSLSTSGLIVTLIFGVGISAALLSALILHFRGRSKAKRAAQVAAMMGSSSTKDVERSIVPQLGGQSEDNLPLMVQHGGMGSQQYYSEGKGAPRLHQGLGDLGQGQPQRF